VVARPIVKWAGGKRNLLPELLARVPATMGTYVEPFAGGLALFFALASEETRRFERAILSDQNEELIACYRAVQGDVEGVIRALSRYTHDEALFYEVRERDTQRMSQTARAARLLFLNRVCFNGLWRVNSKGKFNVPFGRYANPRIHDPEGLRAASRAFAGAEILSGDFTRATRNLGPRDFVYFDPPYVPLSRTAAFTAYAKDGFGPQDQDRLVTELARLKGEGVPALLSNHKTDGTLELYRDFAMSEVLARRTISREGSTRAPAAELLVTTWGSAGLAKRPARRKRA
jgi:DNA adenine methylase